MGWMCTARLISVYGAFGVHHVENRMHDFVAAGSEDRGAENLLRAGIDDDLDEAGGLAFFDGSLDVLHGAGADEGRFAGSAHFRFRHAGTPERRIDEQSVGRDAIADAARIVLEEVGDDDFGVVERRVRKGAAAVAITERPDSSNTGAQLVVDLDVAPLVGLHASGVESKIVCIRATPHGKQQVRAHDLRLAARAIDARRDLVTLP